MGLKSTLFCLAFSFFLVVNTYGQADNQLAIDSIYLPSGSATTGANASFTGPLATAARTYQLILNESELSTMIGKEIKGLSWRLPASATSAFPTVEVIYNNYDIYLSGSVAPIDRSLTFALNVVGPQAQVRSGSLTIPINAYPFGGAPNYTGPEISFNTPWLYNGGHLLIEMRHDGFTGTARSVDAWGTASPGYGTTYTGQWTGSYTGTAGSGANFSVIKFTFDDPVPVELTSFTATASGKYIELNWTTATESNNSGFQVERLSGESWSNVGFIEGNGTTTEQQHYTFTDKNVTTGKYSYRLKQIDYNGAYEYSNVVEVELTIPGEFSLDQNYPNPFNPTTKITFSIPLTSQVRMELFDILGNSKQLLVNEEKPAGTYELTIDAAGLTSGIYFYRLQAGSFSETRKMILMK